MQTDFAVIFDMDGVLVDSEVHWRKVEHEFLAELVPGWSETDQQRILGMSAYDVHSLLVEKYGLKKTRDEYVDHYRLMARRIYGERSSLLEGAAESLEQLHRARITLGLASSSPHDWIGIVLDRFGFRQYFKAVISSDDVGGKGKPLPGIYLHAAAQIDYPPSRCVAIEDSRKGVQSAKAAGMKCVGLRNGFNGEQNLSAADYIVQTLRDLEPAFFRDKIFTV